MTDADTIRRALQWFGGGRGVVLAVVAEVWKSAPRRAGARLAVRDDGEFCGSVSGGCVEAETITAALEVMQSGAPQTLRFGVAQKTAWDNGLPCGGDISLLAYKLDARGADALQAALRAADERRAVTLLTRAADGALRCVGDGVEEAEEDFVAAAKKAGGLLTPEYVELDGGEKFFAEPLPPPPRLLVVGATHIAQALLRLAAVVDINCVVIDPRAAWAGAERFAGVAVRREWPEKALAALQLGAADALVVLTHDEKIDDPALLFALAAERAARGETPFYVGALGSGRTQAARLERLREKGADAAALRCIQGPVGLPIGAATAEEIALSVVAQVVQALRAR